MRENIVELYTSGKSAREVGESLGFSMKVVYDTLRKKGVLRRSASETNRLRFVQTPLSFTVPSQLTRDQELLKMCALALYWGEGSKTNQVIDIANTDPCVLKIFLYFLCNTLHVNQKRIRIAIFCFDNQDVKQLEDYWSKQLVVSKKQFTKTYVRQRKSGTTYGRVMPYGVAHVRYSDKRLSEYILGEIEKVKTIWAGGRAVNYSRL